MENWLLSPEIVFSVVLIAGLLLSGAFSRIAFKRPGEHPAGFQKPYACGEDVARSKAHPDYSQFFPFAFFFTFLHVIALIITTVPTETYQNLLMALIYIFGALLGLYILFRRENE